jgi:hypothetical protein
MDENNQHARRVPVTQWHPAQCLMRDISGAVGASARCFKFEKWRRFFSSVPI